MTRIRADDATNALTDDHATVLASRADGGTNFHGILRGDSGRCGDRSVGSDGRGNGNCFRRIAGWIIGAEAIHDAPLLQIVRCHLEAHSVAGENPHLVHSHATSEVAEELVILGFQRGDADSERRIGITLFYDADEFDDILRHKVVTEVRNTIQKCMVSREILQTHGSQSKTHREENSCDKQNDVAKRIKYCLEKTSIFSWKLW